MAIIKLIKSRYLIPYQLTLSIELNIVLLNSGSQSPRLDVFMVNSLTVLLSKSPTFVKAILLVFSLNLSRSLHATLKISRYTYRPCFLIRDVLWLSKELRVFKADLEIPHILINASM